MKQTLRQNQILRLLFWEVTIKCNLACAHCRRLETNGTAVTDLSTSQGKDLINELAQLGRAQSMMPVLVFSGGEPLCRDDIFELVRYAKSLGISPALATNGTMIDAVTVQKIAESGVFRVAVSLDGATANIHNKLRRLQGCFEKAIEGIKCLREKNVPFQINVTLARHNAGQLEDIYKLASSLGAKAMHIFMLVPVGCGQTLAETDMLSPGEYEQKLLEICRLDGAGQLQIKVTCGPHYERIIRQQGLKQNRVKSGHSRGCLAGVSILFIGHQGNVFPCGYLPINCGNVLKEPLSDIWYNNKELARMRDTDILEGKCGLCGYRKVCGGCRARAYAATGNYMAAEPFCAYVPPEVVSKAQ